MKKIALASLACVAILSGCANGFTQYYRGMSKDEVLARTGPRAPAEPRTIRTNNVAAESEHLAENGYALVGESNFQGPVSRSAESKAVAQAKAIGAEVVTLAVADAGSSTVSMPIATPTTSTSYSSFNGTAFNSAYGSTNIMGTGTTTTYGTSTEYVPISVHRAEYYAGYWVKSKPPILGVLVAPLSPEQHKQLGTNSGVLVRVVVIGSPAYKADIFKGDFLMSIDDDAFDTGEDFQSVTRAHAGQSVKLSIVRDGNAITKNVTLAPATP